jgi:hypothetical protein
VFSGKNLSVEDIAILSDNLLETPSSHSANPLLFYHSIALHLVLVVAIAATIELGLHQGVMIGAPDFFSLVSNMIPLLECCTDVPIDKSNFYYSPLLRTPLNLSCH